MDSKTKALYQCWNLLDDINRFSIKINKHRINYPKSAEFSATMNSIRNGVNNKLYTYKYKYRS